MGKFQQFQPGSEATCEAIHFGSRKHARGKSRYDPAKDPLWTTAQGKRECGLDKYKWGGNSIYDVHLPAKKLH